MKKSMFIAATILAIATSAAHAESCYSDGVRTGVVQKFSKKGLFIKSWEGELVMQGEKIRGNQHGIKGGNVWKFSVNDPEVAKVIDAAVMSGNEVALKYCEAYFQIGQTDTNYRITAATEHK